MSMYLTEFRLFTFICVEKKHCISYSCKKGTSSNEVNINKIVKRNEPIRFKHCVEEKKCVQEISLKYG